MASRAIGQQQAARIPPLNLHPEKSKTPIPSSKEQRLNPRRSVRSKVTRAPRPSQASTSSVAQSRETSSSASSAPKTAKTAPSSPRHKHKHTARPLKATKPRNRHHRSKTVALAVSPAQLVLSHARRAVTLSVDKTSIMDVILDGGVQHPPRSSVSLPSQSSSGRTHKRAEPILDAIHLHHQSMTRIPDARSYVFTDLSSLDAYWREQRALYGHGDEDWSALVTLANVSAERSTVTWSDDSATASSASDALLADEDVPVIDLDA